MGALNVKATKENVKAVLDFVTAELVDFPLDYQSDILVAVEEIFVNIASYAYPPDRIGEVALSVEVADKAVFRFEDTGRLFNPLEADAPDLNVPLAERKIGGLGVHFVKNLMDEVEYVRAGDKNILTFSKRK